MRVTPLRILLLVSLLLGTGVATADSELLDLQPDLSFAIQSLPTGSPSASVRDFVVLDGDLFYIEADATGRTLSRLSTVTTGDGVMAGSYSADLLPGCSSVSLHAVHPAGSDPVLRLFDAATSEAVTYDPAQGEIDRQLAPAGLDSFRPFADARVIAASFGVEERPMTETDFAEIAANPELRKQFSDLHKTLRKQAVFLLEADFSLVSPLLAAYKQDQIVDGIDQRDSIDTLKGSYFVRSSPTGSWAAAFALHIPGIHLYAAPDGSSVGTISHPGRGMIMPADGPVPPLAGTVVLFQTDVLVAEDHLLIADVVNQTIWKLDMSGRLLAGYRMPFYVVEMEAAADYLYLRGRDGELARFVAP